MSKENNADVNKRCYIYIYKAQYEHCTYTHKQNRCKLTNVTNNYNKRAE